MRQCWKIPLTLLAVGFLVELTGCGSGAAEGDTSTGTATPTVAIPVPDKPADQVSPKPRRSKPSEDPLHPVVLIATSMGEIKVELDAENAELTVKNFLYYVESGFYDQTIFHQAVKDKVVLAGGYTADLVEKKARTPVRNEAHHGLKNVRGTIAMVRRPDAIDSATCEFFFNLADNPWLDFKDRTPEKYGYCVFGRVIEGMDVLDRISAVKVEDSADFPSKPVETVLITSARRLR